MVKRGTLVFSCILMFAIFFRVFMLVVVGLAQNKKYGVVQSRKNKRRDHRNEMSRMEIAILNA